MMTSDFLIQPFSQEASAFLACLNQDMQRQEAIEQGKPFSHHACSLDMQIRVHHMTPDQRLSMINELKTVFYRYIQQPDKSLAHVALNYLHLLAYGTLKAAAHEHCLAPALVQELQQMSRGRAIEATDKVSAVASPF